MSRSAQPAIKSYFFGKGYRDLIATIKETWRMNCSSAKGYKDSGLDHWSEGTWHYFTSVAYFAAAISVVFFGSAWFILLSVLHITLLLFVFVLIYLCFLLILGIERSYLSARKIFTACPHCHKKATIPNYKCSKCGVSHDRLMPGSYGILKRTCQCGESLPTTFFNGRSRLEARCAVCSRAIESKESTPICIPIIGGPSVGKTCYLIATTHVLMTQVAPERGWKTHFLNESNESSFQTILSNFKLGIVPSKTTDLMASAFNFFISGPFKPDKVIFFYDPAGEAYHDSEKLRSHTFFDYLHGFLFLVDPFSIQSLVNRYGSKLDPLTKPSSMELEDAFDTMVINLERNFNVQRTQSLKKPCAIVLNKIDAMDLELIVGEIPVGEYANKFNISKDEARDKICKQFLHDLGLGNFLRKLDMKFKTTRFFTCSSLGTNRSSFVPYRVEAPMLWLLENADRDLRRR